jgi:L-lactate dehydrogenase complex protein LldG
VKVRRARPDQVLAAISAALAERGARRLVVPPGLDLPAWPATIQLVTDDGLSSRELDEFDGVITAAAVAVAGTGTIILDGSAGRAGVRSASSRTITCA